MEQHIERYSRHIDNNTYEEYKCENQRVCSHCDRIFEEDDEDFLVVKGSIMLPKRNLTLLGDSSNETYICLSCFIKMLHALRSDICSILESKADKYLHLRQQLCNTYKNQESKE